MLYTVDEHCNSRLHEFSNLVTFQETFMVFFGVINFVLSIVAILGNLLAIRALQKASSIPFTLKTLYFSLALSDLTVGLIVQPLLGGVISAMLRTGKNGSFDFLCPTILTLYLFFGLFLAAASLFSVAAIALDRLLALYLHLRYQAIVTPRRVLIFVMILWVTSCLGAAIYIGLPSHSDIVILSVEGIGFFVTTVAYWQINRVVRYHQRQIQSQNQIVNDQAIDLARVKRSAFNTLYVYFVFIACYVPLVCATIVKAAFNVRISILMWYHSSIVIVFLHSSLNPFIYCWRYREVREIMKNLLKKIFTHEGQA